jgi:hypothetical protein
MKKAKDAMHAAYRVADEILRDRLKDKAPEALEELGALKEADVLVTRGQYDHIESVFDVAGTPYTLIQPQALDKAELRPDQIVFVNCPGPIGLPGLRRLATFVDAGGFLFTTDWALKHVLEPAFPGVVEFNQQPTQDEVVRVEILNHDDPFLASILGPDDDPQWWLESSSYPIRILQPERVQVLLTSKEIAQRYGEAPVFLTFEHGQGRIYHMISHFYLQRTETRTKRQALSAYNYLAEKGIDTSQFEKYTRLGAGELRSGEVESALSSRGMMASVLWKKRQQMKRRDKKETEKEMEKETEKGTEKEKE